MFAHRALLEHEVLQRILVTEPEILLPRLTVEADQTHTLVAAFLAPYLVATGWPRAPTSTSAADFLARMVLSYISSPGRWDLEGPRAGGAPGPVRAAGRDPVSGPRSRAGAGRRTPCYRHPNRPASVRLRPLRPPHLHRVHGGGARRLAVPRVHLLRRRALPPSTRVHPHRPGPAPARSARPIPRRWSSSSSRSTSSCFFLEGFGNNPGIVDRYAMQPGRAPAGPVLPAFTPMFLHANFLHIVFNMIALLIVGPAVEVLLGKSAVPGAVPDRRARRERGFLPARPAQRGRHRGVGRHHGRHGRLRRPGAARHLPVAPVVGLIVLNLPDRLHGQHRLAGPSRRPVDRGRCWPSSTTTPATCGTGQPGWSSPSVAQCRDPGSCWRSCSPGRPGPREPQLSPLVDIETKIAILFH